MMSQMETGCFRPLPIEDTVGKLSHLLEQEQIRWLSMRPMIEWMKDQLEEGCFLYQLPIEHLLMRKMSRRLPLRACQSYTITQWTNT